VLLIVCGDRNADGGVRERFGRIGALGEPQPSKLKVAGSNPAGVASRINHLGASQASLVFPRKRLGKSMGRDAASGRIDPVSRGQCAPAPTSSRRHRSLALTRNRVSRLITVRRMRSSC